MKTYLHLINKTNYRTQNHSLCNQIILLNWTIKTNNKTRRIWLDKQKWTWCCVFVHFLTVHEKKPHRKPLSHLHRTCRRCSSTMYDDGITHSSWRTSFLNVSSVICLFFAVVRFRAICCAIDIQVENISFNGLRKNANHHIYNKLKRMEHW